MKMKKALPAKKKVKAKVQKKKKASKWHLKLYVAGMTGRSVTAWVNLKKICEEHLQGAYKIEIIDLLVHPQLAKGDQILAIPTLIKKVPVPVRKIIGDLSNTDKVLVGLDLKPSVDQ